MRLRPRQRPDASSSRPTRHHTAPARLKRAILGEWPTLPVAGLRPTSLDTGKIFTHGVNMYAQSGNILTLFDKVIHMAFACGCVRSFHVERQMVAQRCPVHGDHMVSTTEEFIPKAKTA